jgi:protocatechuate 3,4-dioxygenase beta subunit
VCAIGARRDDTEGTPHAKGDFIMTLSKSIGMFCLAIGTTLATMGAPRATKAEPTTPGRERPGFIHGYVVDDIGRPIKGATVEIAPAGGRTVVARKVTDATGQFKIDDLPPGNYAVRAYARGIGEVVERCTVYSNRMTTIRLTLGQR